MQGAETFWFLGGPGGGSCCFSAVLGLHCVDLVAPGHAGTEPVFLASEGRFLTTGPPGKSQPFCFKSFSWNVF